jgi:hypothetical protein
VCVVAFSAILIFIRSESYLYTEIYRLTASVFIVIAPGADIEVVAQVFTIVGEIILFYVFFFCTVISASTLTYMSFCSWIFWYHQFNQSFERQVLFGQ